MQELQGSGCVPKFYFRCPWPLRPTIGMELGTPMPNYFERWSEKDLADREELKNKVQRMGYVQGDDRGSNYIRLEKPGRPLVMIDFEMFNEIEVTE